MSNFLKQGEGITSPLNDIADTTQSGQTDVMGVGLNYGGGITAGDYLRLNDASALARSDTATGTLFGGIYRRVLLKAGITGGGNTGFKRGQLVFWDTLTSGANNYQVTNVEATDPQQIAGVIINANDSAAAPLSGKWVWIQVAGIATIKYIATVTDATVGDSVYWAKAGAGADNAQSDALAAATAVTTLLQAKFIGVALDLPVNGALKKVLLTAINDRRI